MFILLFPVNHNIRVSSVAQIVNNNPENEKCLKRGYTFAIPGRLDSISYYSFKTMSLRGKLICHLTLKYCAPTVYGLCVGSVCRARVTLGRSTGNQGRIHWAQPEG